MKCYVTYKMTYAIEVPEEDLKDLCYNDEEEDGLLWEEEYDPYKVYDYFNSMSMNWGSYYDVSLETVEFPNEIVFLES